MKLFVVTFETHDCTKKAIVRAPTHASAAVYLWNELPTNLQHHPANSTVVLASKAYELDLQQGEVLMMDINGDNE